MEESLCRGRTTRSVNVLLARTSLSTKEKYGTCGIVGDERSVSVQLLLIISGARMGKWGNGRFRVFHDYGSRVFKMWGRLESEGFALASFV